MGRKRHLKWSALAATVMLAITAAAMTATEAIKERQQAMEGVLDGMKTLGAIAKKQQPFEADVVRASAEAIASHLERFGELFPEGSDAGDVETWAKPEIWSDRGHFDELLESTHTAAVELQSVTEEAAFPPALGALGNGCKSCHDLYRLPKK